MVISDPIADMLTRVRNANTAYKEHTTMPFSKLKEQIAKILKREGFIKDYQVIKQESQNALRILLKYSSKRQRIITGLKRVSKPGLRVYVSKRKIPRILGGLATVILSTSQGILTDKEAQEKSLGGEILCYIW